MTGSADSCTSGPGSASPVSSRWGWLAGSNVNCSATASDSDHWTQGANSGDEADTIASYTWTATRDGSPVGSFPYGNTGASVTWKAPSTGQSVTITCTADDPSGPHVPPGDTGTRQDDPPGSDSVAVTVDVQAIVWDPYPAGGGISCSGITAPTSQYGYACNSDVTCAIAEADDQDHRYEPPSGHTYPNDTFDGENAYVWSADAGSFPDGNKGTNVTWRAPNSPTTACTITCRVDDDAQIPAGETGNRNDDYREYSVTVKVYKVRCLKVEANYDQDIYWPPPYDPQGYSDKVWAADTDTYASNGTVEETWHRERIADVFHVEPPEQQHYKLTCTFYRYPACTSEQTLTTTVQFAGISGETEVSGWQPEVTVNTRNSVGRRSYTLTFTFKVGGRQVENAQAIPQGEQTFVDFAIYGAPQCPSDEFTNDHLYFATDCGEGEAEEADIAHKVLHEVNSTITTGCICNTSFENIWLGAKGVHSDGQCCCRAKGMLEVLQVLGFDYVQDFVNELAEPNFGRNRPDDQFCILCLHTYFRGGYGGSAWNNWQGVCKRTVNPSTCYSPQGRHESVYDVMNDAPEHPNSQPADIPHAFEKYAWHRNVDGTEYFCTHMPPP